MGFWDICCSIGSAISSACSFVGNCISSVGKAVAGFASGLLNCIIAVPLPIPPLECLRVIVIIVEAIGKILGVINNNEGVQDLGAKATQDGVRSWDEFQTEKEYIAYLRNEIELDRERIEKMSDAEKIACTAMGTAIVSRGISEELKMEITPEFLVSVAALEMKADEVLRCIEKFKLSDFTTMDSMREYLQGKYMKGQEEKANGAIFAALKETNQGLTDADINAKIDELCVKSRSV